MSYKQFLPLNESYLLSCITFRITRYLFSIQTCVFPGVSGASPSPLPRCLPPLSASHPELETTTAMVVRHVPPLSNTSLSCVTRSQRCDTCSDWNTDLLSETKMKTGIICPDRWGLGCKLLSMFVLEPDRALSHWGIKERRLPTFCLLHTLHEAEYKHRESCQCVHPVLLYEGSNVQQALKLFQRRVDANCVMMWRLVVVTLAGLFIILSQLTRQLAIISHS